MNAASARPPASLQLGSAHFSPLLMFYLHVNMREINTVVCFLMGREKQTQLFLYLPTREEEKEEEQHQSRHFKYYSYKPTRANKQKTYPVNSWKKEDAGKRNRKCQSIWFHLKNTSQLCTKVPKYSSELSGGRRLIGCWPLPGKSGLFWFWIPALIKAAPLSALISRWDEIKPINKKNKKKSLGDTLCVFNEEPLLRFTVCGRRGIKKCLNVASQVIIVKAGDFFFSCWRLQVFAATDGNDKSIITT